MCPRSFMGDFCPPSGCWEFVALGCVFFIALADRRDSLVFVLYSSEHNFCTSCYSLGLFGLQCCIFVPMSRILVSEIVKCSCVWVNDLQCFRASLCYVFVWFRVSWTAFVLERLWHFLFCFVGLPLQALGFSPMHLKRCWYGVLGNFGMHVSPIVEHSTISRATITCACAPTFFSWNCMRMGNTSNSKFVV